MVRPSERRAEAQYLVERYKCPKARICRLLGLSVSTASYKERISTDEPVADKLYIIEPPRLARLNAVA